MNPNPAPKGKWEKKSTRFIQRRVGQMTRLLNFPMFSSPLLGNASSYAFSIKGVCFLNSAGFGPCHVALTYSLVVIDRPVACLGPP